MTTVTYSIPTIHCAHCTHTVQTEVSDITGVEEVIADMEKQQATITFGDPATEDQIKAVLAEINYPVAA